MVSIGQPGDDNFLMENATAGLSPYCPDAFRGIEVPVYCFGSAYDALHSPYIRLSCAFQEEESILDSLLLAQWEDRMWKGCFKYDVTTSEIRVIGDHLKFIAQLNQSWSKNLAQIQENNLSEQSKSSTRDTIQLSKELLFCIATTKKAKPELIPSSIVPIDSILVILNEMPMDYGHVFLVPFRLNSQCEHLDSTFLAMIVRMAVEINNHSFRLSCDCSNRVSSQFYFEACYFPNPLAVEHMPLETFFSDEQTGIRICAVLDYPTKTLLFECNRNFKAMVDIVSRASSQLLESNIPYNMLISDCARKIYLFLQTGFSSLTAWECGGYFLFNSEHEFEEATEDSIFNLLSEASLGIEGFEMVKKLCCDIAVEFTI